MELAQHMLVHTLALINNGKNLENISEQFKQGIEFCLQTATDMLQLQVNPKSKNPTHFIDKSYAKYGLVDNKVVLVNYWSNSEYKVNEINMPMDFDLFFEHNKDTDLMLLRPISEHLFYDQVADDMYFVRLAKMLPNGYLKSNKTGNIISKEEFFEIKKYLNILITRTYIDRLKIYGIDLNQNVVQNWCDAIKIVFKEECWEGDRYLKGHMDIVFDKENLSNEFILKKIEKLLSLQDFEEEIKTQINICSNVTRYIYESRTYKELKDSLEKNLSVNLKGRRF